jgi:hypothetical protein
MAMGCGVYSGPVSKGRDFCKRCGIRRSIHRRWKVVEGGENKEATMSAYAIETSEAVPAGRKAAVVDAMKVLLLADPGAAIHVQVSDAERWAEAKATMHPSKVRLVSVKGPARVRGGHRALGRHRLQPHRTGVLPVARAMESDAR